MNLRFLLASILGFLLLVGSLFLWSTYKYYNIIHADDPIVPEVRVDHGETKIVRGDITITLIKDETYPLIEDDILETSLQSKATILWPDKSITRLGPETRIIVKKMYATEDYETLQVRYDMEKGKVWNKIIRILIGESYFQVRLPKQNIVAGVRGTTFEINLDNGYIHAVDHTTELTDILGRSVILFPGEIVESANIGKQIQKEYLDTTWNEWNTLTDTIYEEVRSKEVEDRINTLGTSIQDRLSLDTLSREVLKYTPGFESLEISESLIKGNIEKLEKYKEETLLEYYQKVSGLRLPNIKEQLRSTILEKIEGKLQYNPLKILLQNASIWESLENKTLLPEAERLFEQANIFFRDELGEISTNFDTKGLLENLSGALRSVIQ